MRCHTLDLLNDGTIKTHFRYLIETNGDEIKKNPKAIKRHKF